MDEKELIRLSKEGDTQSFSKLIAVYENKLYHHAFRMLKSEEDAQDAVQEALLKVWRKLDSYSGTAAFSTWLYTIIHNVCLDILRKKKRTGEQSQISLYQNSNDEEEFEISVEDNAPGPYENVQKKAAVSALKEAIAQLSQEHREVIVLRDIDGLDYDEIASITGASLGTVKSRISRARLALRKILEKDRELFM